MAGFKTFTSAALTSSDVNGYLMKQAVIQCTSATRPTGVEGMTIYETDTDKLLTYTGATWSSIGPVSGALTTYTPTLTQSGAVTKTINVASYMRIGRMVIGNVSVTATGAGTGSNPILIGIPITSVAVPSFYPVGAGGVYDISVATFYPGTAVLNSTTTVGIFGSTTTGALLGQGVMTAAMAAGDVITVSFAYEAAADA